MLSKYKMRVNNEAESKEAQELFKWLGYLVVNHIDREKGFIVVSKEAKSPLNFDYYCSVENEITLSQLRDLVVLNRNDVNDATHKHIGGGVAYKTVDDIAYLWTRMGWEYKGVAHDLVTLHKEGEQGLISGADALRALADGKDVEYFTDKWVGCDSKQLVVSWYLDDVYQFRIKPNTVKIEIDIPAPFEPEDDDEVYFIDCDTKRGYSSDVIGQGCDPDWIQFGAWRSEDEIKQVVAALRSALTSK